MKRATAVIGAAFGDEGKGLMVDYFSRQAIEEPWVVRFNGGAQAGHTVVCPTLGRHVFHHFGAGTFAAGARTYLSRHFLVNPVLWREEYAELDAIRTKKVAPLRLRIFVDREAPLTTIYDMLHNQADPTIRGHGTCGVGIHNTMVRQLSPEHRLFAGDLERPAYFRSRVERIREAWMGKFRGSDEMMWRFLDDCEIMRRHINLCDSRVLADRPAEIIFEGAQGLLLDQDSEFFPHVTHSKTGLANVLQIAAEVGISQIDACYVTRPYLTRHGAGPLPGEDMDLRYADDTNVDNPWQGRLRFAPMNIELIENAIFKDLVQAKKNKEINVTPLVAVTHIDQLPWGYSRPAALTSSGPTHKDVVDVRRR